MESATVQAFEMILSRRRVFKLTFLFTARDTLLVSLCERATA